MGTWVTKEMHLGTLFICERAGKSIKSALERGHTEAFFKWQLSRARKYSLRAPQGGADGRFLQIHRGSVDPSAGEWNCMKILNGVWGTYRKSHLRGPRGAQRAAWGPGWFLREGPGLRGAPRSPRVPEGGITCVDLSATRPRPAVSRERAALHTGGPGGCVPPRGMGVAAGSCQSGRHPL